MRETLLAIRGDLVALMNELGRPTERVVPAGRRRRGACVLALPRRARRAEAPDATLPAIDVAQPPRRAVPLRARLPERRAHAARGLRDRAVERLGARRRGDRARRAPRRSRGARSAARWSASRSARAQRVGPRFEQRFEGALRRGGEALRGARAALARLRGRGARRRAVHGGVHRAGARRAACGALVDAAAPEGTWIEAPPPSAAGARDPARGRAPSGDRGDRGRAALRGGGAGDREAAAASRLVASRLIFRIVNPLLAGTFRAPVALLTTL